MKKYLFATLLLMTVSFLGTVSLVRAETVSAEPVINTKKTDNGTIVQVNFPEGYSGQVTTVYDGKDFKTTTSRLTKKQIDQMNARVVAQQKAMQQFFEQQQAFFAQQQKMFDDMWKNFGMPIGF